MFEVCCVGILVADCLSQTVDRLPQKGKLSLIDSIRLYSGGCASNTAIDLSVLGAKTALVGMVGRDGFGAFLREELKKHSVNIGGLIETNRAGTSASVALIDCSGERSFLHYTGANAVFTKQDINMEIVRQSDIVFVAGSMLMPSFDGEPCAAFLKKCKEIGKTTVLDTAWDDTGKWNIAPCLPYLDYFIPSYDEAAAITGENDVEKISDLFLEAGVSHVVIKTGKDGCFLKSCSKGQNNLPLQGLNLPAYASVQAVDTTGAGDSFCAGFLYGLSHGMELIECAKLGNAVGSFCVSACGATTGIRPYNEVCRFIDSYKKDDNRKEVAKNETGSSIRSR